MHTLARNPIGRSEATSSPRCRARVAALGLALALLASIADASAQTALDKVRACAAERDDARRLACFDREVAAAETTRPAANRTETGAGATMKAEAAATAAQAAPPTPEEKFGYRGQIARKEIEAQAAANPGAERIEAAVVEVATRPRGELVLTLDNGQVWAQKTAESARVKVGDRVTIKKASFGSFLLVLPNNRTTRVTREK